MSFSRTYHHDQPESFANHLERFQIWLDGKGTITEDQKRGLFLDTLDDGAITALKSWIAPRTLREVTYSQIIIKMDEITPAINWLVHYSALVRRLQKDGESGAKFMSELKTLAASCGFGDATCRVVLGQFVYGLRDREVQARLLEQCATVTADIALAAVQGAEQSRIDSAAVRGENPSTSTQQQPENNHNGLSNGGGAGAVIEEVHRIDRRNNTSPENVPRNTKLRCYRCGEGHHSRQCPKDWKNFYCEKCSRYGHKRIVCRSRTGPQRPPAPHRQPEQPPAGNTNHLSPQPEYPEHLYQISSNNAPSDEVVMQPIIVQVSINGMSVPFEVDSGAARSLISLETFNTLFTSETQPEL